MPRARHQGRSHAAAPSRVSGSAPGPDDVGRDGAPRSGGLTIVVALAVAGPITAWLPPCPGGWSASRLLPHGRVRRRGPVLALRGAPLGGDPTPPSHPDGLVGAGAPHRRCRGSDRRPRRGRDVLFGLSTVTVTTASAAGALEIAGLDRRRALAWSTGSPDGRPASPATPRDHHRSRVAAPGPRMLVVYPVRR